MKCTHNLTLSYRLKSLSLLTAVAGWLYLPLQAHAGQEEPPTISERGHQHGDLRFTKLMLDRFEVRDTEPDRTTFWEGQAWYGSDTRKLWLKTEGEAANGRAEDAEVEVLYSRAIAPFWDVQAGLRHELKVDDKPSRDWLAFAFKGLAPYMFEVDASLYIGEDSRSALRLQAEYDLLLTQRLVLMPEIEANFYGKDDAERELGSGLSDTGVGLRLRYEIRRKFAPYMGVVWTRSYGDTADYARAGGGKTHDARFVAGLRTWW